MNTKAKAIQQLSDFLQSHILKLKRDQKKLSEEKIVIKINYEEYECENDLIDAYGGGIITRSQYVKAMKRFETKNEEKIEIIKNEINLSIQLIQALESLI